MILKNTSQYPTDEVEHLVRVAVWGTRCQDVAICIKNSHRGYRGSAYPRVPRISPFYGQPGVRYLVTVGIGGEGEFPCDNLHFRMVRANTPTMTHAKEHLIGQNKQLQMLDSITLRNETEIA